MVDEIRTADASTWPDVERLLGVRGETSRCWCMFWRLTNREAAGLGPDDHRASLAGLVGAGEPGGLLCYRDGATVGWASVAPRASFHRLFHTKGLDLADPGDAGVWSIVCVYVAKPARGTGVTHRLVEAAVAHARAAGATSVEGYPVADPGAGRASGLSSGTLSMFLGAGFTVPDQPAEGRRVVATLRL